jgi:hypothetical protein
MTGKISEDADLVLNGTEKFAATRGGTNYGPLATSIATWLATLTQTLTNKTINNPGGLPFGQCVLAKSGANLVLTPLRGNLLTVNNKACSIPDAGLTLAPTGLTPSTFYYIYATATAGAVNALEASATVPATEVGTGNRIKSGDATRSLVGAAYVIAGPAFADTDGNLLVLSWFNRRRKKSRTAFTTDRTTTSDTVAELNSEIRGNFISWADEMVDASLQAAPRGSATPNQIVSGIGIDSTSTASADAISYVPAASFYLVGGSRFLVTGVTENALHFATVLGRAASGGFTATWDNRTSLLITVNG